MAYKIRKQIQGKWHYSSGGTEPRWYEGAESGKTWNAIGQLKNHLNQFVTYKGLNRVPDDWEVVEVKLVEVGTPQSAKVIAQAHAEAAYERHKSYVSAAEEALIKQERAEYERLKAKYGG